ncbi:aspartate kinase [Caballeronia sp. BCC1704]|uniref:amino acid kinase family protein n=1 Tax=Caballeronia sp. BCC1704 TaxID=2676300 RepID=UPI00158D9212|nr:aspartate kinase [Caballeronia sp. BCC1704]
MRNNHLFRVMKFGGSSFADEGRMRSVCQWVNRELAHRGPAHRIVCVVSAPTGLTEQYRDTLLGLNAATPDRLIDAGLPLADSIGAVLFAAALHASGLRATVLLGSQIGLRTDLNYTRARLLSVDVRRLADSFQTHDVIVIPGGQASAQETGETTWMGKNSSDLSAIALAAAFGCEEVEICSDVPGVYSCDPNLVADAHLLPTLSYRQAKTMSLCGAKVLHHRGVEYADEHGIRIVCRANHGDFGVGTVIDAHSPFIPAVIPDTRSRAFAGAHDERKRGAAALVQADVPHLSLEGADGDGKLVVTCGFFDSQRFLIEDLGLALKPDDARLLTIAMADGSVSHELVASHVLAGRTLAQHMRHCSQETGNSLLASSRAVPFDRRLAVWGQTEHERHV